VSFSRPEFKVSRSEFYNRRILDIALQRIRTNPVVVLEGPRTVGKSTLLQQIAGHLSADIIDLDDTTVRDQVESDPHHYVRASRPVLIDEYLRLPLLEYIKAQLNRDGSPGQFVLTGSAGRQANREGLRALVGRLAEVEILPLSQIEIEGLQRNMVLTAFRDMEELLSWGRSHTTRTQYIDRVLTGGFPRALLSDNVAGRFEVINNYVDQSLNYGISAVANVREPEDLRRLLFRYGAQTGQLLNMAQAAQDLGINPRTGENYTRLLELLFFVYRLSAWKKSDRGPVSRPKLHMVDSGVGGRILRLTRERAGGNDPSFLERFGHLLETFVVGEVRKAVSWLNEPFQIGHWRTGRGLEVDLVVERLSDQTVLGMEVKSASRVTSKDYKGLRVLRQELGSRFHAGMVLYTGDMPYQLDERIYAVPIDKLWHGDPQTPHQPRTLTPSILTADGDPLSPTVRAAADEMLERLALGKAAWWELAIVPSSNISFSDFYSSEGVMGELARVVTNSLRLDHGYGLGNGIDFQSVDQCVSLIAEGTRGVLIDPLGTMVAIAGSTFLRDPRFDRSGSVTFVNHLALREWALEFVRFSYRVLLPQGQGVSWTLWSRGRSLREGQPPMQVWPFKRQGVVDNPPHRGILLTGDPEVDAFYLISSFYEWFGIPATELSEAKEGRVSAEEVLKT